MTKSSSKKSNGLSLSSSASPTSSSSNARKTKDSKEGETTAEFRRLVVQEQVRSLRRRLWHAFQNEDTETALRAYKATARDLQAWIREEIEQAKENEERRLQEEKEKKEAQRPAMMKRLSLGSMMHNNNSKKEITVNNRTNMRRSIASGEKPKESALFTKMKKAAPNNTPAATNLPTYSEIELIMSTSNKEGNENALLPLHINPSDPFVLDDYQDPFFEIDATTGEARSVASINSGAGSKPNSPTNDAQKTQNRQFKSLRKRKGRSSQPRTATSSFWASLKILEGRRNRDANTTEETPELMDESESNNPEGNANDPETIALSDPRMTTPLHEAARLGNAELVRLMLKHPFVEPNFKNGVKRTALHMVTGGWTGPEERLWRALQQKRKIKLNHKNKTQGLKRDTPQAEIGISSPQPIEIDVPEETDEGKNERSGAKKAARAMSRFFHTTFSSTKKATVKGEPKGEASLEPHGYLVWDEQLWNRLKTERMDCLLALLTWSHPEDGTSSAGENASVNAVDGQGRTALHYAAELGREDICMAVLSSFGAMLTVVDDTARTPCELAAEQNHPELAAQLEARALLYSDPYGMDDELLAAVMAEQRQPDESDLDASESDNIAVIQARMSLVAPFSWFQTLSTDSIAKERTKRLDKCRTEMMAHLKAKEEEIELTKVMYGMKEEGDDCGKDKDSRVAAHDKDDTASGMANGDSDTDDAVGDAAPAGNEGGSSEAGADEESKLKESNGAGGAVEAGQDNTAKSTSRKEQDGASSTIASPKTAETVLTEDDILSLKLVQSANVEQFLSQHDWIVDKAMEAYKENPVKALGNAAVPLDAMLRAKQRSCAKRDDANEDSISNSVCLICFDEFDIADCDNWTHLVNCSHSFCNTCLGDYLADCAQSRSTGLAVPCPHHECVIPMSPPEIKNLAPNPETYQLLNKTANDNFIASASDLRFCPHPGCEGIVKASLTPAMKKCGIDFDQLAFTGAVCTAVHGSKKDPDFDLTGNGPPPVTYEGVVDLRTTDARSAAPPKSAHRFCFGCGDSKYHFPVTCECLDEWKSKMETEVGQLKEDGDGTTGDEKYDDIAQRLWMRANTRPCPKCKAPIEKNEGCNHMTCFNPQCKHEFCWICRKDWKLHNTATGGFFRCNRWQDEDNHEFYDSPPPPDQMPLAISSDAANDEIMNNPEIMAQTYGTAMHETRTAWKRSKEMKRFLHHYTRWNAHMESAALEKMMSENVCTRLAPVVDAATDYTCDPNFNFDGKGLSFVHAAFKELLECRSVLQHSYAYSFFKFESLAMKRMRHGKRLWNEKAAFEQMQSELEIITEQMSDIVARSHLRATQTQILFLTVGASERRNEFVNLIFTLMNEEKKRKQSIGSRASRSAAPAPRLVQPGAPSPSTSDIVIQGIANEGNDGAGERRRRDQQTAQETVREALMASLEAFMANTEDPPAFVARADDSSDDDEAPPSRSWACSACTYFNSASGATRCAMCGTPAGR